MNKKKTMLLDRKEAGYKLAQKLLIYKNHSQNIVLGLPRGGVPVAHEIAHNLHLPLDVCLVRKLGLPQNSEIAVGAVAEDALLHDYSGNITIFDQNTALAHDLDNDSINALAAKVKAELRWRDNYYRNHRPMLQVKDRIVIVVDDGIATGLTMHAAIKILRKHQPKKIIVAIPVAPKSALQQLKPEADEIVCLLTPKHFNAVSYWYKDFKQVSDREVCDLLNSEVETFQETVI